MTKAERQKEWESRIAEYRASGQSVKEWCTANDIKPERLWYWLRKHRIKKDSSLKILQWEHNGLQPKAHSEVKARIIL